jgi:hypothetical protein
LSEPVQAPGAGADSLRSVLDSVFAAPSYQWIERRDFWAPVRRLWFGLLEWLEHLEATSPGAFLALRWALIAVLVAIFVHAAWIVWHMVRGATAHAQAPATVPPPRGASWYREEADRLARAGNYREAIQADFTALILALDARRLLRFHPSKTPGEYVAERSELGALVHALYAYLFARVPCGPAEFDAWRSLARGARDAATA